MATLPELDFTLLQSNRSVFLSQLREAMSTIGFLSLSNALAPEFIDSLLEQCRTFFSLPLEEKRKIAMIESRHFRGYSGVGDETTANRLDAREQIDNAPETGPIPADQITRDTFDLQLYGPNLFPERPPGFKETILSWRSSCQAIAEQLVDAIGEAVEDPTGTGKGRIKAAFAGDLPCYSRSKCVRYPGTVENAPLGVGAHKDGGGLTLLFQDQVGGLQVQRWDGAWLNVPPGKVIVNIGQVLENLTAGSLRATTHRVVIPKEPRISCPYFYCPPLLSALKPLKPDELHPELKELIKGRPEEVTEIPAGDLHFERFGIGAWKGITRSHRAVYAKWYGSVDDPFR